VPTKEDLKGVLKGTLKNPFLRIMRSRKFPPKKGAQSYPRKVSPKRRMERGTLK